ncbi:tyrosine-type recombinase/integrase [Actinomadura vinacea]|uniref:tyrosine-type recombinase/integrase n=1 Tax=Actinomadura vinacea TaxID=115336 RepID=UPI003CD0AAD2
MPRWAASSCTAASPKRTRTATEVLDGIADRTRIEVAAGTRSSPHALRHTLGTTLARQGVDVVTLADMRSLMRGASRGRLWRLRLGDVGVWGRTCTRSNRCR